METFEKNHVGFIDMDPEIRDEVTEGEGFLHRRSWISTHNGSFNGISFTGKCVAFTDIQLGAIPAHGQ